MSSRTLRRASGRLGALALATLLLAACSGGQPDAGGAGGDAAAGIEWLTDGDAPAAEAANLVPDATLRVRFYDEPSGFDPASIFRVESENIAFNVYSGLVTYDGVTGEIVPDVATDWSTTDNMNWTFNLREGVTFHQGYGDLTAEDVVYSYQRITDPATGSPVRQRVREPDVRHGAGPAHRGDHAVRARRQLPAQGRQLPPGADRLPGGDRGVRRRTTPSTPSGRGPTCSPATCRAAPSS